MCIRDRRRDVLAMTSYPVPDAAAVFDTLLSARILIKNVGKMHPLLANCVRLTVGTPDENAQLLAALKLVLR